MNFSATARHFFIDQSALSKHISDLERELKAPLFLRDRRSVRLTFLGKLFVNEAKLVIEAHDEALAVVSRARSQMDSVLRVGYLFGASRKFLPYACKLFGKEHPNIDLELRSLEPQSIKQALDLNEIDLGISVKLERDSSSLYRFHKIYSDSISLVVSKNHKFAKRERVNIDDLAGEKILVCVGEVHNAKDNITRFLEHFSNYAASIEIVEKVFDQDSFPIIAQRFSGPSVHPTYMKGYYGSHFKFIHLDDLDFSFDIVAYWKKSKEQGAILKFVSCIDQAMDILRDFEPAEGNAIDAWE